MGKPKGYPSPGKGKQGWRKPPLTTSPVLEELMRIMDGDDRDVRTALGSTVNKVTVSRWRRGAQKSADLQTVERVGAAYGYRLQWVRDS